MTDATHRGEQPTAELAQTATELFNTGLGHRLLRIADRREKAAATLYLRTAGQLRGQAAAVGAYALAAQCAYLAADSDAAGALIAITAERADTLGVDVPAAVEMLRLGCRVGGRTTG